MRIIYTMIKNPKINSFYKSHRQLVMACLIVLGIALLGIGIRVIKNIILRNQTNRDAVTAVAVIKATPTPTVEEIILPGNVSAWHEATIYARTNGYVKQWKTDIGSYVKTGDLLAEIETPELNAQLRQAEADLKTAQVNNQLAQSTAKRWTNLLKTNSVSQQETDEKISDALAKAALVNSVRANRDRLRELVSFERVIAPFDGVITSRTTDIGSLISDGSTNQRPLFHIAQANPLRIYVKVPQNYSSRVTPEMTVELSFAEHPDKIYSAKLLETAKAIDPLSRTLLAQFVTENKNYDLLPGGYTQVHLKFPAVKGNVRLPVNTLLFRKEGLQIATLDENSCVLLKSIKIVRDFGNEVEVDSGVKPGETVIVNPPDSLITGQHVRIVSFKETDKVEKKAS